MGELRECPFADCRGSAPTVIDVEHFGYRMFRVSCPGCGSRGPIRSTRVDARSAWNRRTPSAVLPGEPTGERCGNCFGMGQLSIGYGGAKCGYCNGTGRTPASTGKAGEG